jgi:hypothetical protein
MDTFWNGFEKQAKKKKKRKSQDQEFMETGMPVAATSASALGGMLASGPLFDMALKVDKDIGSFGAKKLVRDIRRTVGHVDAPHPDAAYYAPSLDKVFTGKKMNRASTVAHEMGHAITRYNPINAVRLFMQAIHGTAKLGPIRLPGWTVPAAMLPGGLAMNESTEKIAPYSGLLYASPILLDEAQASAVGLYQLAKHRGFKAMAKGVLPLTAALGTYASAPLAAGLMSKYLIDKKHEKDKKKS